MAYYEDYDQKQKFNLNIWGKMLPYLRPYTKRFVAVLLIMLLVAAIDIAIPLFLSYAVNHFIVPMTTDGLGRYAALYGGILVLQGICVLVFGYLSIYVEMRVGHDVRRKAFRKLQTLDLSYYNTTPVGYILARVMSDTNRISIFIAWGFVDLFWSAAYVVGVFIAMLALNVQLALIVMAVVPFVAAVTAVFQGKILRTNRRMRSINSRITASYNEGITGAKTSKTLVIEDQNSRDFAGLTREMYKTSRRATILNAVFIPIIMFFGSLATAFVLVRGGYLTMAQAIELGTLSAFVSYAVGILEPIQQMARVFADFVATQVNIERVTAMIEREELIVDSPEVQAVYGDSFSPKRENWEPLRGEIEFKNVWFKYPDGDEYVLEDFNLTIPAGTNIAIVGETGAGKSTLVNLACRFFEPTRGQILIDGRDYRERSQLWLHSRIGYVLQNPHLFSGTVRENILYGKLDATDADIDAAARLVAADAVIKKLENGLDTDVGEGGNRLSTGEKQLISFARAVIADPPIFVLDEATSSIDTETEQLIQHAISRTLSGRTSFLIAHRLSTIRHADIILVVRQGKIIERGTHDELLAAKGYYHSLFTAMQVREARQA